MANSCLELLKNALLRRGASTQISPQAEELSKMLDHFNQLHWHDRDLYHERIKKLEATIARLDKLGHPE